RPRQRRRNTRTVWGAPCGSGRHGAGDHARTRAGARRHAVDPQRARRWNDRGGDPADGKRGAPMKPRPIRLLIADDHDIVREGVRMCLTEEAEIEVVGEAANGAEAVERAAALHPDVVLMDLMMPEMDGIQATQRILADNRDTRILILTSFADDRNVREA